VFTSDPQAVEVYQSGAWWPGQLLGWRHDTAGTCQVWVRVVLGAVEESAWTDLTSLRLPETNIAVEATASAEEPAPQGASVTGSAPHAAAVDLAETASLPLVRDRSVASTRRPAGAPASAGAAASIGRRRAPEDAAPTPAPDLAAAARGRHRAPGDLGRHRAADTGLLPAVTADPCDAVTAQRPAVAPEGRPVRSARASRPAEALTAQARDSRPPVDPEPELLTRPMRLSDLGPRGRRPRLDGFLAGV
jgi:hypothetical protein